MDSHPNSVSVRLTLAHLHLTANNTDAAASLLAQLNDPLAPAFSLSYRPAVVSVLVALYLKTGKKEAALELLESALLYWRSVSSASAKSRVESIVTTFLLELLKLQHLFGKTGALEALEKIYKSKKDKVLLCKIIIALAAIDPVQCASYESQLPEIDGLKDIQIQTLENMPAPTASKVKDLKAKQSQKPKTLKPKQKKNRKIRLPKAWDPTKPNGGLPPIDPERWLPKFQRSTFKLKGKKKNLIGKGSQGAVAKKSCEFFVFFFLL